MSYDPLAWIPKNPCLDCEYNPDPANPHPGNIKNKICIWLLDGRICWKYHHWRVRLTAVKVAMQHVRDQATGVYKDLNGNEMQALPLDTVDRNLADLNKVIIDADTYKPVPKEV